MHFLPRHSRAKLLSFPSRVLLALTLALSLSPGARAGIIASWTFETNPPPDVPNSTTIGVPVGIPADVGVGTASGVHASAATDWTTPAGNGSDNSLSSNTWGVGDYYRFDFSTAGLTDLVLTFDQTSSGTGPRNFKVQTSSNGTDFTDLAVGAAYTVLENGAPNPAWSVPAGVQSVYSFGAFALPDGIVAIRLIDNSTTSANGGTVAATGTSRVDNVTIEGVAVPEPASLVLLGLGMAGLAAGRRWRKSAK